MNEAETRTGRSLRSMVTVACGGFVARTLRSVPLLQVPLTRQSRKMRLLLCAYSRSSWPTEDRVTTGVEIAERFVDGCATRWEFFRAGRLVNQANDEWGDWSDPATRSACLALSGSWLALDPEMVYSEVTGVCDWTTEGKRSPLGVALFLDVFGNLFQAAWMRSDWGTPTVARLAEAAYQERDLPSGYLDLDRFAVLADALEDGGCDDAVILEHLRSPGPHIRGCWALDLILEKS